MRIALIFASLIGAATLHAADPFVTPSFVKSFEELGDAREIAAKEKKGITFLLMEPGST